METAAFVSPVTKETPSTCTISGLRLIPKPWMIKFRQIGSGPHKAITIDVTRRAECDMSPVGASIMSNKPPSLDKIQRRHSMGALIPFSYPGDHSFSWGFCSLRVWLENSGSVAFSSLLRPILGLLFPTEPSWSCWVFGVHECSRGVGFHSKDDFGVASLRRLIEEGLVSRTEASTMGR